MYLFGKFADHTVPGLGPSLEWQAVVYDKDRDSFYEGDYMNHGSQLEFSLAGTVNSYMDSTMDSRENQKTAYLTVYRSPRDKNKTIVSYNTWLDARYVKNPVKLPYNALSALAFTLPAHAEQQFLEAVVQNPHLPGDILRASPYGRLMWGAQEISEPVIRKQSNKLTILNLISPGLDSGQVNHFARRILDQVRNGRFLTLPLNPPVGDVD